MITNDPDPDTDYMTVKNHAGAVTKYYFQKGGFRSHSYNNKSIYTGRCRAGSNKRVINIEEPNFLIKSGQYLGVNRIKAREEAEEPDAKKISYAVTDRVREAKLRLFIHYFGGGMIASHYPNRAVKRWAQSCGTARRVHAYMCRYTYCTRLVENGVGPCSQKKLMGHKQMATTLKHYLKLSTQELRR